MTSGAIDERRIFDGYAEEAAALIAQFEALSSAEVLAPVADLLPARPSRILEVGAGTGRDAAWLAEKGHRVVAVEPVRALREAGRALHPSPRIVWVDDSLPDLATLRRTGELFDLVLLVAVWQHLRPDRHAAALADLAALTAPGGRLILSLRHGPGASARPCFPAAPEEVVRCAGEVGFSLLAHRDAASVQARNRAAGVTWTWLAFRRG